MPCGRTIPALRAYATEKGGLSGTPTLADIGISNDTLDGTYFTHETYAITSASVNNGQLSFVITCTAAGSTCSDKPSAPAAITLTCNEGNDYTATFAQVNGDGG